jgi:DNA-binding response OmpR family regulator
MPMDKPKILLIDDEKDILEIFKKGLEIKGFEVDAFSSSAEAIIRFKPFHFDFVITDIRMPGLNGLELYRLIRQQDDKVKIFFMTAFEIYENDVKLEFPDIPPDSFINKPTTIGKLVELLVSPSPEIHG